MLSKSVIPCLILSAAIVCAETPLFAQARFFFNPNSIPVYRSKQDSIELLTLQQAIIDQENITPIDEPRLDSLRTAYSIFYPTAIIGFRNIYSPSKDHITLDSLSHVDDLLTVKRISIHNYKEKDFPANVLQCDSLESLELINTNLRRLPKGLNNLKHLREVRVYNNRSRSKFRLEKNEHVTTLEIRSEQAKKLPRSYRGWRALESLDLSENMLTRFPNGARHNTKLKALHLQRNLLTLKRKIKPHPHVETLALQHNQISHVPASIQGFSNLRKLNFNYNKVSSVHPSIQALKKLEQLSFYHNELKAIPSGVYQIQSLRDIDLFYNQIEKVESNFNGWKNLVMLYLSHNHIVSLPETIRDLSSLQGLYIWDNRIDQLPQSLGEMTTLRFIWANHNNLTRLPRSILKLELLEELDISHNFLTEIPEGIFDFKRLRILSLVNNPWNKMTMEFIPKRASELRARNVYVHISERDPPN